MDHESGVKHVIIMRGIQGSGKSTWALNTIKELRKEGVHVRTVSSDHGHINSDGNYEFKPEKINEAHLQCFSGFLFYLKQESDMGLGPEVLIVDNTNIALWEMTPYVMLAKAYGVPKIEIVQMSTHIDTCLKQQIHALDEDKLVHKAVELDSTPIPSWLVDELRMVFR